MWRPSRPPHPPRDTRQGGAGLQRQAASCALLCQEAVPRAHVRAGSGGTRASGRVLAPAPGTSVGEGAEGASRSPVFPARGPERFSQESREGKRTSGVHVSPRWGVGEQPRTSWAK